MAHPILICTVGTSLFRPNLEGLKKQWEQNALPSEQPELRELVEAYVQGKWRAVAQAMIKLPPSDRLCGAEINSIASMIDKGYVDPQCDLYFLHSQTEQGGQIAEILAEYYRLRGHPRVECVEVSDLQDAEPKRFRNKGLRNLVREMARVVREHSPEACAINATGGYKAQIAIAVVLGQALGVRVYYKHELFNEVIAFPPLPVALDFQLWMRASGMLAELASPGELVPAAEYEGLLKDERYESLVEREEIDGVEHLALSPAGQIFYETYKDRFWSLADRILPSPALTKKPPHLENAGWPGEHPEIEKFMQRVTDEVPFVVSCATSYYHPNLPQRNHFRLKDNRVEGVFSDGTYCVKFWVETTAQTEGQLDAAVAALNEWLRDPKYFIRSPEQVKAAEAARERDDALAAWEKTEKQVADLQRQNAGLQREREELKEKVASLETELARAKEEQQTLQGELGRLQTAWEAQKAAAEQSRQTAEELAAHLAACQRELAEAKKPWWRRLFKR